MSSDEENEAPHFQTRGRALLALAVVVALIIGALAVSSYRDHDDVRQRALAALLDVHRASASQDATPTVSAPSEARLPIGEVVAATPPTFVGGAGSAGLTPVAPSSTSPNPGSASPPVRSVSVAVLTPLLSVSKFGASVGFLLVCNTAASSLSAAATQVPGLSEVLSPVVAQISPLCGQMSDSAVSNLNMLNAQLGMLEALNPGTQAFFQAFDGVFATLDALAPQLAPLSGVVSDLGPLVNFFAGPPAPNPK